MKYIKLIALLGLFATVLEACKGDEPDDEVDLCLNVECVNGDCVDGTCDCDVAYTGAKCDKEKAPAKMSFTRMVLKKFPLKDGSKDWDPDEEGDEKAPDVTIEVTDVVKTYFKPQNLNTQLLENATEGSVLDFNCNFSVSDFSNDLTFTVLDYDYVNLQGQTDFMGSTKVMLSERIDGFPEVISIKSGSGSIEIDVYVDYSF